MQEDSFAQAFGFDVRRTSTVYKYNPWLIAYLYLFWFSKFDLKKNTDGQKSKHVKFVTHGDAWPQKVSGLALSIVARPAFYKI